jgi:transposase
MLRVQPMSFHPSTNPRLSFPRTGLKTKSGHKYTKVGVVELKALRAKKRHLIEKYNREKDNKSLYLRRNWQQEAADCTAVMDALKTEIAEIDKKLQTELGTYSSR